MKSKLAPSSDLVMSVLLRYDSGTLHASRCFSETLQEAGHLDVGMKLFLEMEQRMKDK